MRETANFASAEVDGAFRGTDREAVEMAHYLLRNEGAARADGMRRAPICSAESARRDAGLFVGPSAALNVVGAVKLARKLGAGCTVATVLCDGGERYRATTFSAEWLRSKGLAPEATGDDLGFVG